MQTTIFKIQAVKTKRQPRYPSFNESVDVKSAQRRLFSPLTIALAGIGTLGMAAFAPGAEEEIENKKIDQKKVAALVLATLETCPKANPQTPGQKALVKATYQNKPSSVKENPDLTAVVKIVHWLGSGDGQVAQDILDVKKARETTVKLFELYGVRLKKEQMIQGKDISFEADGYHPRKKIGFELTRYGTRLYNPKTIEDSKTDLVPGEWDMLSKKIKEEKMNILLVDVGQITGCDFTISGHQAMKAYLKTVVDYLEWLRTSGKL